MQLASNYVISSAPLPSLISLLQGPTPLPPELQQARRGQRIYAYLMAYLSYTCIAGGCLP